MGYPQLEPWDCVGMSVINFQRVVLSPTESTGLEASTYYQKDEVSDPQKESYEIARRLKISFLLVG